MRKYLLIAIGALIIWNLFLTFALLVWQPQRLAGTTDRDTSPQRPATQIETDFTRLIAEAETKVVGIQINIMDVSLNVGSGAIYQVNEDSIIIITSAQSLNMAHSISVRFASGQVIGATLIGIDEAVDIAVLEVSVSFNVEAFRLGDSSLINIGEWVISMSNPDTYHRFGMVEIGIITGRYRGIAVGATEENQNNYQLMTFQTNMNVHQGITGGPVINAAGELLGINSTRWQTGVTGEGATVIPINEIIIVVDQILENGYASRYPLGLGNVRVIRTMPIFIKNQLDIRLDLEVGLYVESVFVDSVFYNMGIRQGDIITQINGEYIITFNQYQRIVYQKQAGDTIEVVFLRGADGSPIVVRETLP